MSQVRKCYNENCENNYMGAYCECCEITIDENGCCYNYFPKQEEEKFKPSKRNWSLIINEMDSILTDKIKEKSPWLLHQGNYIKEPLRWASFRHHHKW